MTLAQVGLLGFEMYTNYTVTGSPIQTNPFNYMIGPEAGILIRFGARFLPCMKSGTGYDKDNLLISCPTGIVSGNGTTCTLEDICKMPGTSFSHKTPNQWYRFISPIFLHTGVIHLLFNMSFQVTNGFQMEREMGFIRMALIYFISGVGGFVFGASLSDVRSPSVGASGSLYGMIACLLLDLFQNWRLLKSPWIELIKMLANILLSFGIGMLPGIDNLAHAGGFVTGLFAGFLFLPRIYFGPWDKFVKQSLAVLSVPLLLGFYGLFIYSFLSGTNNCTWCRYVNCIPGLPWCDEKFSSIVSSIQ